MNAILRRRLCQIACQVSARRRLLCQDQWVSDWKVPKSAKIGWPGSASKLGTHTVRKPFMSKSVTTVTARQPAFDSQAH